ncbi:MAG: hypothetical protein ACRCY8_17295 [Dermatophilaceae bacterium]
MDAPDTLPPVARPFWPARERLDAAISENRLVAESLAGWTKRRIEVETEVLGQAVDPDVRVGHALELTRDQQVQHRRARIRAESVTVVYATSWVHVDSPVLHAHTREALRAGGHLGAILASEPGGLSIHIVDRCRPVDTPTGDGDQAVLTLERRLEIGARPVAVTREIIVEAAVMLGPA